MQKLLRLGKVIPNSPLCNNVFRAVGLLFELLAQAADVDVDGADVALVLIAPDEVEEVKNFLVSIKKFATDCFYNGKV